MTNDVAIDSPRRVAVLGVGLLGGSVALSIRRTHPETVFVGWARSEQKREQLLNLEVGGQSILDDATTSFEEACDHCDVVVVATPVDLIADVVQRAAACSPAGCLITDVGSTKAGIVESVMTDPVSAGKFVAAHPIAGSEKSGAQFSVETLFDQKTIVLTPHCQTPADRLARAEAFWRATGGAIVQMTPEQHDTHLAAVSHVPHLVSALVAKMTQADARPLVGSGWQDITRVAAGDPSMWTAICQENRAAILAELERFSEELGRLSGLLKGKDDHALADWLANAKQIKEQTK